MDKQLIKNILSNFIRSIECSFEMEMERNCLGKKSKPYDKGLELYMAHQICAKVLAKTVAECTSVLYDKIEDEVRDNNSLLIEAEKEEHNKLIL